MTKGKLALALLFGPTASLVDPSKNRSTTVNFPAVNDSDVERHITYPTADGLILTLLKRIEELEAKVAKIKK